MKWLHRSLYRVSTDDQVAVLQAICDLSGDGPGPVSMAALGRELGWTIDRRWAPGRRLGAVLDHLVQRGYVQRDGRGWVSLTWDYRHAHGAIRLWADRLVVGRGARWVPYPGAT